MQIHNQYWRGRPIMSDQLKAAIAEHRKTHLLKETAAAFNCSVSQVWKISTDLGVRVATRSAQSKEAQQYRNGWKEWITI